jgi:DNA-binding PadR family transcriptional regulator
MKRFDVSLALVWPAAQSQVYTELNQLAAERLIEVKAKGPRGRKLYTLTDSGLAELRRWLVEVEPRRDRRNEVLLRVFFLGALSKEQAVNYLRQVEADATMDRTELGSLDASITWDEDSLSVYGRLVLEFGYRLHAMRREWARWAIEQLETSHQGQSSRANPKASAM